MKADPTKERQASDRGGQDEEDGKEGRDREEQPKVYGKNRVFCKGRFISGPDSQSCIASLLMIFIPSVTWQVTVGSFFALRDGDRGAAGVLALVIHIFLMFGSLLLLLATALSDPGIMPRQKDYHEQYDPRTKTFRSKQPPRYHDLVLRGHPFKLKYCPTCNIYRPPRCTHCSVCENCTERFDHHCPWIGNCIGKRNYWLFYSFVTLTDLLCCLTLALAIAQLWLLTQDCQEDDGLGVGDALLKAMRMEPLSAALVVYCTGTLPPISGLWLYHNYLVCTNQTTYEQIKGAYLSSSANPFHRGILGNYRDILCSPVRPRLFRPDERGKTSVLWPRPTLTASTGPTGLGHTQGPKRPESVAVSANTSERALDVF